MARAVGHVVPGDPAAPPAARGRAVLGGGFSPAAGGALTRGKGTTPPAPRAPGPRVGPKAPNCPFRC